MKKSDAIQLEPGATTLEITEGEIEIEFQCIPNGGTHLAPPSIIVPEEQIEVFQTYRIKIPAVTLPVPTAKDFTRGAGSAIDPVAVNGWYDRGFPPRFYPEDVVRGIELRDGDARIVAYSNPVPPGFFREHEDYEKSNEKFAHGFRRSGGINTAFLGTKNGGYVGLAYGTGSSASEEPKEHMRILHAPVITSRITNLLDEGWEGDFDTGLANLPDGSYLNKSDEGGREHNASTPPYYYHNWYRGVGLFSPLKQSPSAVIFGSLPTGVKQTFAAYESGQFGNAAPWRTLLFCPNPLSFSGGNPLEDTHFGAKNPPDYLLLDLFTMPIVEPYAISEPFSTAGRLNMNYQIVPFTHIKRKTAMIAALTSQQVVAINNNYANNYKDPRLAGAPNHFDDRKIRFPIDAEATLTQFDAKFNGEEIFRSASEICSLFLVPQGEDASSVKTWWSQYKLTGNNLRERPYATLYPLLTTKSNVFTTHLRAQAIKRTPAGKIQVNGEYRGSATFERYLDPNDSKLTDGSFDPDEKSLEPYFRFRTLTAKQFDL